MENGVIQIDDQPIDATFFGEVRRLTDFITPDALEVKTLYDELTEGINNTVDKITACWRWIATQVKYVQFVKGKLMINGKTSWQGDYWQMPSQLITTLVGNCANKSFLLCSLLRNILPAGEVYCTLGNLYNGKPGGHAWISLRLNNQQYVMESTTPNVPPLVPASVADRYEAVHYFNDLEVYAVEGKTQLKPYAECYSTWLSDYLHWAYMESQKSS